MARGDWMERGVAWDNVAVNDGTGDDEPTISFVDDLEGGACCGRGHDERVPSVGLRLGGGDVEGGAGRGHGHAERVVGLRFRKIARGDWTEHGVAWDDVAGDDGAMDDEPTISFVDDLEGGASYDVDVLRAWPRQACTRRRTPIRRGRR